MSHDPEGRNKGPRVLRQVREGAPDDFILMQGLGAVPDGATAIGRLQTVWQGPYPHDPTIIASAIGFQPGGAFFCDSTVFLAPTAPEVWDALLREKRVALISPILSELQWWLNDPRGINLRAHAEVQRRLGGDRSGDIRLMERPESEDFQYAGIYYVNLLGVRKHSLDITRYRLEKKLGRAASAQEVSNYCQQQASSRAQLLGRQGTDVKLESHRYHDEWLVVAALMHAIVTGEEVTILTSDEAVLDQFYKAVCLLNWHYVAMAFADRYAERPFEFSAASQPYPEKGVFVADEALIINKSCPLPLEFLSKRQHGVQAHCMLLQRDWTRVTYRGELEMRRLLEIKGRTRGLSTDRFGKRNCHLFVTHDGRNVLGDVAAIAEDVVIPDRVTRIGPTDLELSLLSNEQSTPVLIVDPTRLQLPSRYHS